jgi:hypothetical protein
MDSDYIHNNYNNLQDHYIEERSDPINVLPCPPESLTFTGLANGYKEESNETSLEQTWDCMGYPVVFSNIEETLTVLPTLFTSVAKHMNILLNISNESIDHNDKIDEAVCHQLFCRIYLFIERYFVLSDNLPSSEQYRLLLTSIEQLSSTILEWTNGKWLKHSTRSIPAITLFVEMQTAIVLWLDLLGKPARDEMSLHVDCSFVCNDAINLLLRMVQHQMTFLYSFNVTPAIEALQQLYSRNTLQTNDIGYWLLTSWCTIIQVMDSNEFWQEFNVMLIYEVTQQNVRHQPTATWSLHNVDSDNRQHLQTWIIIASHLQHLSIQNNVNTIVTHEECSSWTLLRLLVNEAINRSQITAINSILVTSWRCIIWFNWPASVALLRLMYSYFDSMQLTCSINSIELSSFLQLLNSSLKSLVGRYVIQLYQN